MSVIVSPLPPAFVEKGVFIFLALRVTVQNFANALPGLAEETPHGKDMAETKDDDWNRGKPKSAQNSRSFNH
ncbi:MAG TPA: hypothetical protein VNX26_15645 [Candidatus Acidoferrum sp.]|nr:hypothetical protein [Candidatus Acidoferrum sp.]